jgi:hypothetical protein
VRFYICSTSVAALLFLLPMCGGCMMTTRLSDDAETDWMGWPHVSGQSYSDHSSSKRDLVVTYGLSLRNYSGNVWCRIPLDENGSPPAPFAYTGNARSAPEVLGDLNRQRLDALPLQTANLRHGSGPTPNDATGFSPFDAAAADHAANLETLGEVLVVTYRIGTQGQVELVPIHSVWPKDVHILVLPNRNVPRPADDLSAAKTRATLLAPLTILGDIVTFPVQAIWVLTHWPKC